MEIDFANLTDEMKEEISSNLTAIEEFTGRVVVDPTKPLSRTAMEQLKIAPKIDGEVVEMSVWDGSQKASMAESTAHQKREAAKNAKAVAAMKVIREYSPGDKLPDNSVLDIVAKQLGMTRDDVVASLTEADANTQKAPEKQAKGDKTVEKDDKTSVDTDSKVFKDAVKATILEHFGDQLLPSKIHGQYVNSLVKEAGDKALAAEIAKAMDENPAMIKLRKGAGDDPQKKKILESLTKIYTSTVEKQARGRIAEIASRGEGDIEKEIPGIAKEIVETVDPNELMTKVAPELITYGASEQEDAVTILSTEKLEPVQMGEPGYEEYEAKLMGQRMHELSTQGT